MPDTVASTPDDSIWAPETEQTRREQRRATTVMRTLITFLAIGAAAYLYGLYVAWTADEYWPLLLVMIGIISMIGAFFVTYGTYRRVPHSEARDVLAETIFHASGASWEPGEEVTLTVDRCRRRQFLAARRARIHHRKVVYFFPHRPTEHQTRGQILAGRKRARRYLYEMAILAEPAVMYQRESAIAVPHDLRVRVVAQHAIPARRTTA